MRHRRKGRTLGRAPSHRKSLLRNMASALILTERDAEFDPNPPKVPGRIVTTLEKAKEVRPLVEKCVTIARRSLEAQRRADQNHQNPGWESLACGFPHLDHEAFPGRTVCGIY